jgi:hypothetical protein
MLASARATRASGGSNLVQDEAVERNAGVEQPEERCLRHQGYARIAQGDHVVFPDLAFEHRPFSEPRSRGNGCERHGLADARNADQLHRSVDDADPGVGCISLVANVAVRRQVTHDNGRTHALQRFGLKLERPGALGQHCVKRLHSVLQLLNRRHSPATVSLTINCHVAVRRNPCADTTRDLQTGATPLRLREGRSNQ